MAKWIGLLIGAAIASGAAIAPAAPAESHLTVMVFQGIQNLPLFVAQDKDFFAKRGLQVDLKIAPTSQEWREGLAQNRHQIAHGGIDNAVAMASAKMDTAIIMGGDNAWIRLFARPEINSYENLRGKTVTVDAPNTAYALVLYEMLARRGLKRGDYEVKSVGATFARFDAILKEKDQAATLLTPPFTIRAQRAGLKDLGSAIDVIGPYVGTAGAVMRPWAQANADVLIRYLEAYIEALRWALDPANKAAAVAIIAERLKIPPDVAAQSYEIAAHPTDGLAPDARFDLDGFKNVLKLRAEFEGRALPAPESYLDLSYYQRALAGL